MISDQNHKTKSCKRVPFLSGTRLGENRSESQIYKQISLPLNDGTINGGRFSILRKTNGDRAGRAAFCSFSKAGMTVEAALVIPLFLMVTICVISMIHVYGKSLERAASLRDAAMVAAFVTADRNQENRIFIELPVVFTPFFLPEGLGSALVPCRACVRAWNGRDDETTSEGKEAQNRYVYVTDYQSVYHTSAECTHLDLSIHAVPSGSVSSLRNEDGARYHVCEKCGNSTDNGVVYVTPYGDCYHKSSDCPGLKRTVRLVNKEELENGLCECSRCAAKAA